MNGAVTGLIVVMVGTARAVNSEVEKFLVVLLLTRFNLVIFFWMDMHVQSMASIFTTYGRRNKISLHLEYPIAFVESRAFCKRKGYCLIMNVTHISRSHYYCISRIAD